MPAWNDERIARGMTAQLARRRELLNAGIEPLGWKLAFGSPAAMSRLRITAPLVGFLMRSALVPSGSTLSIARWTKPAAEPELAMYLGKDLHANSDRSEVMRAIAALGPAIEVADIDHPSEDVEGTLARNIYQRHIILGRKDAGRAKGIIPGLTARVAQNSCEIANTNDLEALTSALIEILRHLADLLAAAGELLRAGQIVIAGSITPPIWVRPREEIIFHLDPIDMISVRFEADSAL